jgi:predicted Zn-dependent protease with MMP-like domain
MSRRDGGRRGRLSEADWDGAIESALAELPPQFRKALENVSIQLQDEPDAATLDSLIEDGELDPDDPFLLGLFDGIPLPEQVHDPLPRLPGRLLLYRRNLEEACSSRRELIHEIRVTMFHEIGHALGYEEDELEELGFG